MEDSALYGSHAAVNNHSMGSILSSSVPFGYNVADSYGPIGQGRGEDICDILQQIISISSQSLDEAQMRFVAKNNQLRFYGCLCFCFWDYMMCRFCISSGAPFSISAVVLPFFSFFFFGLLLFAAGFDIFLSFSVSMLICMMPNL